MEAASLHMGLQPPISAGELVVQNGRQAGVRRPLGASTTFIGRSTDCDIRLNVVGVNPMHCLLVFGPDGLQLRDLATAQGTYVNDVRTDKTLLAHGDIVKVGPFKFRVELPAPAAVQPEEPPRDDVREALRTQAAAIAAQQAALDEEEARLQQRSRDLQQQEEQLADHLAEKQRQVQLWSDYTKTEHETLRKEKLEQEKRIAGLDQELLLAREEVSKDHEKLTQERQRILQVYKRLRQRWQRHWSTEKEKLREHAQRLHIEELALETRTVKLQEREAGLAQQTLQFNSERELGLRQLHDARAALAKERQTWRRRRSHEFLVLKGLQRKADEAQLRLKEARRLLVDEKAAWDQQLDALQRELHGLNNRILHQRLRIDEQSAEMGRLDALLRDRRLEVAGPPNEAPQQTAESPEATEAVDVPAEPKALDDWQNRLDSLERLASELADQRAQLLEQYQHLAQIQETWKQERDHTSAEMEQVAHRLLEQEQFLAERDQQAIQTEESLRHRQQECDALREELQVWRAQLKARAQLDEEEQKKQLDALARKQSLLQEQLALLAELRQRWNQRRQQELERLRADRAALDEQHKETHDRRVAIFERALQVESEKRMLAEKVLAVEQYKQEVLFRANDPSAKRRIERLRRRWLTLNAALIRNAKAEHESARMDLNHLDAVRAELTRLGAEAPLAEAALAERQAAIEEQELAVKARQALLDEELAEVESRRQHAQDSHLRLQDEIDELAKAVYEGPDAPPIDRAA